MSDSNFIDTLKSTHHGELVDEADILLKQLIAKVKERGGTGKVKIQMNIKNIGEDRVEVAASIDTTIPARRMPASVFYANDVNELHRNAPHSTAALFKHVDEAEGE